MAYTISNGETSTGILLDNDSMTVLEGGKASKTTLQHNGNLLLDAGLADITMISSGGTLYVSSIGIANSTTVGNYGNMHVSSGGTANNTIVNGGGNFYVSLGGIASNTTVNSVGWMHVFSGGTANSIILNGYFGSGGILNVSSGGSVNDITINGGGDLLVLFGGTANSITVKSYGYMHVSGTVNSTTVQENANMYVSLGAIANSTTVYGSTHISSGAIADSTKVFGSAFVFSGGVVNNIIAEKKGSVYISSGGAANEVKENGGCVFAENDADITFVANTFSDLTLSYTTATIHSGTIANSTTVNMAGNLRVYFGGTANNTTVNSSGWMHISSGGTANNTVVNGNYFGGELHVSSGGVTNNTTVNSIGSMWIYSGGVANNNSVFYNAKMYVAGTANNTTIYENGNMYVSSGGTANNTTINSGACFFVSNGGAVSNTTVNDRGYLYVSSSVTANNALVLSGGRLIVSSGGRMTGRMTLADGAIVSFDSGAILDFDISELSPGSDNEARINKLSLVSGNPDYTLTVSDSQGKGMYILAEGAESFNGTITIQNTLGEDLGALSVGNSIEYNKKLYQLDLAGGNLELSIYNLISGPTISSYMNAVVTHDYEIYSKTWVLAGGRFVVSSGGIAKETTISGGTMYVLHGGIANGVNASYYNIRYPAEIFISSGGTVKNILLSQGGELNVYSGGMADNTTLYTSGSFTLFSGGTANNTILRGGQMSVSDGNMYNTTISGGGLGVGAGVGIASRIIVSHGGTLSVASGGTALEIVEDGGVVFYADRANVSFVSNTFSGLVIRVSATVHSGTIASDTTISGGGTLLVFSSGIVKDVTLEGGSLFISSGGTATGQMVFSNNARVVVESGSILDFDISNLTPEAEARINNLSQVSRMDVVSYSVVFNKLGWESGADFTITVSDTQTKGTYILAYGAAGFGKKITVQNTIGKILGTISVGESLDYNSKKYTLCLSDETLSLSVKNIVSDLLVEDSQNVYVYEDELYINTTVNTYGRLWVSSGGIADNTTVDDKGSMLVCFEGTANSTTINSGGSVSATGFVNDTIVNSYGSLSIEYGGRASRTSLNYLGRVSIENGGIADSIIVSSYGAVDIRSGGTANNVILHSGNIYVGGEINDAIISGDSLSDPKLKISNGGIANRVSVENSGSMEVFSNGVANSTLLKEGGSLHISGRGSAMLTTLSGGNMDVGFWSLADSTTIEEDGQVIISSGGTAKHTTVNRGRIYVESGGTASDVLENGGFVGSAEGAKVTFVSNVLSGLSIDSYAATIHSGTTATSTFVNAGGSLYIYSGGKATEVIENGGGVYIYDGAEVTFATDTNLFSGLTLSNNATVHSGTIANSTILESRGRIDVFSGGIVNNTTVNFDGEMVVSSGGTANNTTINSGSFVIDSGGTAVNNTVNDGSFYVLSDGVASNNIISAKYYAVIKGTVVNNTINGVTTVSSGGVANINSINGIVYVLSGGLASNNEVRGRLFVSSGGTALEIMENGGYIDYADEAEVTFVSNTISELILENRSATVHSVTTLNNATINGDSYLEVFGGTVNSVIINGTPYITKNGLDVFSGGTANDIEVNSGGVCRVSLDAITNRVIVSSGGTLHVSSGGTANDVEISSYGRIIVSSGGVANNTTINSQGYIFVQSTGIINNTILNYNVSLAVESDSIAENTTVNSWGIISVLSGGLASKTTVNHGGTAIITSGGTAIEVIENGGFIDVEDGASVTFASNVFSGLTLGTWGTATVHSGTTAVDATINRLGSMYVHSGGVVDHATVNYQGSMFVYSGGIVGNTIVNSQGSIFVSSGGTAKNVTVSSSGRLFVSSGGIMTGQMSFESGAVVSAESGTIIDFDISRLTPDEDACINNLSQISYSGRINAGYTLTVSDEQESGVYVLAYGADDFARKITVKNTSGTQLGTISVGGKLAVGKTVFYSLGLSVDALTLTVSPNDLPTVSNIQASITTPTNQNVVITADFADDFELASSLYKVGEDGEWIDYRDGVEVSENTTVFFKAIDAVENESDIVSYVITNIDKTAPVNQSITADKTTPTNQDVIISVKYTDNVSVATKQYKLGENGTWTAFVNQVVVKENATVYFKAIDTAGNESEISSYVVNNIDRIPPDKPIVSADVMIPTYGDVFVIADFSQDTAIREYSLDNGANWTIYTDAIKFINNGVVLFRATDEAGNVSETASYEVKNIDKIAPDKPVVSADTTLPTNTDVLVSAEFSEDSMIREYSLDGENWIAYTEPVRFTDNGSVSFRGTDEAGNISTITSFVVNNIDKIAPAAPKATADITTITNDNVSVSATFSDDSVEKEYSLDGETWLAYTSAITFNENGSVFFRGMDEAGNYSEIINYTVNNIIDSIPPTRPIAVANIVIPTNTDVIVTATFSDDSAVREYSLDGETWLAYTSAITFNENGSVFFRAADEAGNISEITNFEVTNIDKIAPEKPIITVDITEATNHDVTVSASFSNDSAEKEYSLDDGGTWMPYTDAVRFKENGSIQFRGIDEAGNVSEIATYEVSYIDKVAPTKPVALPDVTTITNGNVVVSASFSEDSSVKEYSIDGQNWLIYTDSITFTENGTVFFRGTDAVGNISEITSYAVTNIDKIAPVKPKVSADVTEITNGNVIISASFSDDSAEKEYSFDGQNWQTYIETIQFTENGSIFFRGTDTAGNISEVTAYEVTNIDKVAPIVSDQLLVQGTDNYVFTAMVTVIDNMTAIEDLKYYIRYATSASAVSGVTAIEGTSFSLNESDIGRTMYYQIGIQDKANNITWTEVKPFSVADRTMPVLSGQLYAIYSEYTVSVSWDAATDNVAVAGYRLILNDEIHDVHNQSYMLSGVGAGTYTYQVIAYDDAGNESSSEIQTLTVAPRADLCVLSVQTLKGNRLATTVSNQDKVTLSIQIGNIGDVKTSATTAYIYCGEVRLAEIAVAGINPDGIADCMYTIEAGRMSSGIQNLRVVIDANDTVLEYSEANNEKSLTLNIENHSACDLVIGSVQLNQPVYSTEDSAILTFTVKNIGYIEASASKAYIYDGDTLLGSVDVDAIVTGEETEELNFTIDTSGFSVGSHVIYVVADGKKAIPETNRENNSAQVQLVVGLGDLTISKLSISQDAINTEDDVTLSFTVRNSGASKAAASVAEIYDGDKFLGAIAINEMSAGLSISKQFIISAGTLAVGKHNLRVVTDAKNEVEESDETNNSRSVNIQVIQKDERPPEFTEVSIQQGAGDYGFTVTAVAVDDIVQEEDIVYCIRFSESKDELVFAEILDGTTFGLTPEFAEKTMYYQVSATDLAGNTTWSIARKFTVADHTAPEIMNLSASLSDNALQLSWDAFDNVSVSSYKVYLDDGLVSTQETTSYTQEGISIGRHTYRIEAYDAAGNMATTGNMKLNFDDTVAPVIESVSAIQSEDGYNVTFAATATDNETQTSDIVTRVQYAFAAEDVQGTAQSGLNLTLDSEDAGKTLYYRVSATDEAGNFAWSEIHSLVIADKTAPDTPADLIGTVNGSGVMLSWTASADNVGVTGYRVRYGSTEALSGDGIVAAGNQYALTSLKEGVYYWQTAAMDASGNVSEWSEVKSFRILPEDAFGTISTADQAFDLGTLSGEQTLSGGAISSASDADWFRFTLNAKGTANDSIQIAFDGSLGDLDLYLYSANGSTLLVSANGSTGNSERISLKDMQKGTYLLKVIGKNGAMNTFSISTKKVAGYDMDIYDANGRNDSMEAATVFDLEKTPQATVSGLNLHEAGDTDYYQFTLANMGLSGDGVSISFENSVEDLDLVLFDSKGVKIAESAGTGSVESVSFNGLAAGTYYIQVSAAHNAVNEYTLNWNFTSNKVEADALEGQEPYAITESVELTNLSISATANGVTQEDTFKLTLNQPGSAASKIRFSNYRSDWNGLKYVVKDSADTVVLSGTGSEISLDGLEAGDYSLTVDTPVAGSFSSYDISVSLPESAETKWTYMVYMAADSNLDTYALYDLIAMQQANLDSQIDIYVLVDRSATSAYELSAISKNKWDSAWSDTRVGKITYNPGTTVSVDWESWGELDTSSIATLKQFVDWAQDQSKSENYGLIMWDHGMEDGSLCVDGATDADWGTSISVSDVSALLAEKGNIPLVIFNNCLLGSEIVATKMSGSTDVIVVSEAESHPQNSTYAYKNFFSSITADMSAQDMAKVLVQGVQQYGDGTQPSMLSAVDVADAGLAKALESLASAVTASDNANDKTVLINGMAKTLQDGCAYAGSTVYQSDLYDMIVQAMADRRYSGTSEEFKAALANLKSVLEDVVLSSKSIPANRGYGIATFNPVLTVKTYAASGYKAQKIGELVRSYLDANYAANPAWGELLYDLTKTYQSQIGSSVKVASYSVTSIIDIGKDELISSIDLGCFSGQGEINDGISLLGDVYLGITITSEATSSGGFTLTNDVGTDVSITIIAQDGSPVASGLNAVSFSNLTVGDYIIILNGVDDCTVTLAFEADWMTGVDRLDFAQSKKNEKFANGNGSIAKASSLAAGYYSGLLTYQGDTDWYQIGNVYTEKYRIELGGAEGLTVAEYDAEGNLIQTAKFSDGVYTMTMKSMNYLFVEGNADLNQNQVNAYSVSISGVQAGSDTTPPDAPTVSADITAVTNGDVSVSAVFSEDSIIKEYSLDGENWIAYTEPIQFTDNGSVSFRGTDEAGNISEVTNFLVSNIDKVAPTAPTASSTTTNGNVLVSAQFSEDSSTKEYSIDGQNWLAYTEAILFTENGSVFFRGKDEAGNISEVTEFPVVTPDNEPDNGKVNDVLYDKKTGWNDANITVTNPITGNGEINLDSPGSIDTENGYHNMFGNDGTNKDTGDVAKIDVETAAKLTFKIDSTAAGTFYVYEDGKDKNGKRKLITVGKVSVKAGTPATLKDVCLTGDGKYYVAMTAKNVKKAGTEGLYNVSVTSSKFFVDADSGWNDTAAKGQIVEVGRSTSAIVIDSNEMTESSTFANWVGFSDNIDYAKLDLASSAYLSFDLKSDGAAKFTIWKQDAKGKLTKVGGVTSLTAKNNYTNTTKAQFLDTSKYTYYISMECTDAKKGGSAYYNVSLNGKTVFFDSADNDLINGSVYDKKKNLNTRLSEFRTNDITASVKGQEIFLDGNEIMQDGYSNFVGYNDKADYAKFSMAAAGDVTFTINTTGAGTFAIYRNNEAKKKLEVVKKVEIKTNVGELAVSGLAAGDYFISMTAKSTKANASGSVFYNVWANATLSENSSDALSMPETSDALGISDALSFGGYDADVLADASASSLAELDDKSAWQSLLA